MKRLIHIVLRHRDIVFETPGDRLPQCVDNAEDAVTIFYRIHNDAQSRKIEDLIEGLLLCRHFFQME